MAIASASRSGCPAVLARAWTCASPSPRDARPVKRHVDFVATLYVAWGAIFALVAIAGFALAGGAFALAESTGPVRFGSEMAARLTGVTITIIAVIALVWAGLHIFVGRRMRKMLPSARLMALGLAL